MVCTEKDWVKLKELFTADDQKRFPMGYIPVEISMDEPINIIALIKSEKP